MDKSRRSSLRTLRGRLAAAAPRARGTSDASPQLLGRLDAALQQVSELYLLLAAPRPSAAALGEAVDDAIAEGQLLLHELERRPEGAAPIKPTARRAPTLVERRQHGRWETRVTVTLLRHSAHVDDAGGISLGTDRVRRPARNISVGGIFVTLGLADLPQLGVGSVVHLDVERSDGVSPFQARAVVMRRDASEIGLRWLDGSERARQDVVGLVDAVRLSNRSTAMPTSAR